MRTILTGLLFLFLIAALPAAAPASKAKKEYYTFDGCQTRLDLTFGMNDGKGFGNYRFLYQPQCTVENTWFTAKAGLRAANRSLDAMTSGVVWPLHTAKLRAGAGALYHFYNNNEQSYTHDILAGGWFETHPARWFSLHLDVNYMLKARYIEALDHFMLNRSIAFDLNMGFHLPADISLHAGISSYEPFRYNVLCAPSFTAGISYEPRSTNLFFGCEAVARYTDFFTNAAHYDSGELRLTMGFHL